MTDPETEYRKQMNALYQKYASDMLSQGKPVLPRWRFEIEVEEEGQRQMWATVKTANKVWMDVWKDKGTTI